MRISDWSSDVCSSDLRKSSACTAGDTTISTCFPKPSPAARRRSSATSSVNDCWACPEALAEARLLLSPLAGRGLRSEEHTSELQSLMRTSYAAFCLKKNIDVYI